MDEKWQTNIFGEEEKVLRRWDKNMGYVCVIIDGMVYG
jgi:hypothetical protein